MTNIIIKKTVNKIQEKRIDYLCQRKINKIYRLQRHNLTRINNKTLREYKKKWQQLARKINSKWLSIYSHISGQQSSDYVSENIYYNKIEPRLNNRLYTTAQADKNIYNKYFPDDQLFPRTIWRNINGVLYDARYQPVSFNNVTFLKSLNRFNKIVVKPATETGGGRKVELFTKEKVFLNFRKEILSIDYLKKNYFNNFIIQEYIEQHDFYKQFNPSSTNTVRIFTYRSVNNEKVIPLHAVLRMGRPGYTVDNQAAGGISCGITPNGMLNDFAVDKWGNVYKSVNSIVFAKINEVFMFAKMVDMAKAIAPQLFYSRLNGFDFCLDKNSQVKLLEINTKNIEINFLQMNSGPLFKDYTDEIIEFCRRNSKSICWDFYV